MVFILFIGIYGCLIIEVVVGEYILVVLKICLKVVCRIFRNLYGYYILGSVCYF